MSASPGEAILGRQAPERRRAEELRLIVFLQGTVLMHSAGVGRSREERVAQAHDRSDPTVRDHASYVPVGNAVAKLRGWHGQGARIDYLSSRRGVRAVAQDAAILKRYDFPVGQVLARGLNESYGDVVGRECPDVLIEDDCASIGAEEITYPQIRPDLRPRIRSIIVPEFGGIDHLPDSLQTLLALGRNTTDS